MYATAKIEFLDLYSLKGLKGHFNQKMSKTG